MSSPQRFSSSLKGLAGTVLELLQVRLELLSVEAQEEALRIAALLVYSAFAVSLLSLGLGFLAMLITVALWDSHRLLPLAVFAVLFLALGGLAAYQARQRVLSGSRLFSASLDELRRDREDLRP
ncbi:MAG: phage holin family protein [Hydrogenophaga sp.]|uniref:phage holin family protein n=1 Tax=Hydrogenophaga sp. TaxID=1904254 RepID=UPI00272832DA|nr:phage holin family protein [Hydrogenophaga sp.]MDO9149290.1 phage holin family protein [Hydrogenophaga sp.]MDO9603080.1 phage holin family protein [Hydrogenophaga sp.]MDP2165034.1 phage holin family protein [Hydrogenophaga sp.]MDP3476775.1 phage holin family protein [Hydrogenophaga sp.]